MARDSLWGSIQVKKTNVKDNKGNDALTEAEMMLFGQISNNPRNWRWILLQGQILLILPLFQSNKVLTTKLAALSILVMLKEEIVTYDSLLRDCQ